MKNIKIIDLLWALSLFIIGALTIVLSVTSVIGYSLPKALTITFGILELIALFILVFTTVKKIVENKKSKTQSK